MTVTTRITRSPQRPRDHPSQTPDSYVPSKESCPSYFRVDSITSSVSSSLPNNPKLLIVPAFGAFSLGLAASALLYACCNALVLAA